MNLEVTANIIIVQKILDFRLHFSLNNNDFFNDFIYHVYVIHSFEYNFFYLN